MTKGGQKGAIALTIGRIFMGKCEHCLKHIEEANSCDGNTVVLFPDGTSIPATIYAPETNNRCPDCNIAPGGVHHPGCSEELCPRCDEKLIECGCVPVVTD